MELGEALSSDLTHSNGWFSVLQQVEEAWSGKVVDGIKAFTSPPDLT